MTTDLQLIGLLAKLRGDLTDDLEWALSMIDSNPQIANTDDARRYVEAVRHLKASQLFAKYAREHR